MIKQDRREFLLTAATATSAMLLSASEVFSLPNGPSLPAGKNYELQIMATNWGFDGSIDSFVPKLRRRVMTGWNYGGPTIKMRRMKCLQH